jgi:single-strand DNA-binding protein
MNDLTITVTGWVATEPKLHAAPSGSRMTTFRLATTSRYFDRDKNEWTDGRTEWFSVRVFRAAAVTVAESIAKGQPVTVHGRFRTNEWESETGPRTDLMIDAQSVGHDLTRGIASFKRASGSTDLPAEARPYDAEPPVAEDDEPMPIDMDEVGESLLTDEEALVPTP